MVQKRYLLVIEHKETGNCYLWNPLANERIVPKGYVKVTMSVPLDEKRFGILSELIMSKGDCIDI